MTATAVRLPKTAAREDRRARRRRDGWGNAGLLAPFMIFYLLFLVGPLVYDVVMSFFNTSLVLPGLGSFAGLRNYTELFGDSRFWQAMWHTILFTLVSTPPLVIIPLFFAIVVNRIKHGQWFFRLAFFLPYILPSAVIALIWTWLYEPGYGLIDGFFQLLGLGRARLAVVPEPGAVLRRHRHRLVDDRLQLRPVPGRTAGHPARPVRGPPPWTAPAGGSRPGG